MAESSTSTNTSTPKEECLEEESNVITMVDVLKEEEELEDDAKAVLGASDDQNCTYSRGYVKRQALYACMTCIPLSDDGLKPGGICLACSYHCHEGHELVELYTKRNFKCDCGNSRFANNKCNLEPNKSAVNDLNSYNHNFRGMYCTCGRPYPDPEDVIDDEMIQCVVCEDWYHGRHLGSSIPVHHDYGEMVCGTCMHKHAFLWHYKKETPEDSDQKRVEACNGTVENCVTPDDVKVEDIKSKTVKTEGRGCLLKELKPVIGHGAVFFSEGWRKVLCRCDSCQTLYETQSLSFLMDDQDTVQAYEEQGKASGENGQPSSRYEQGLKALSSLDRIKQVEAIEEYNNMKIQLKEYLQKFAENKKVVREEDIREFFSGMDARKKQRIDVQVPYFCH
jgi:E3 ubiquitin-protein ligase UBR7